MTSRHDLMAIMTLRKDKGLSSLGLRLRFTGARKRTGKKNKKKKKQKKNQEKIGVTRVDTIGDAAELLSPNDLHFL